MFFKLQFELILSPYKHIDLFLVTIEAHNVTNIVE